jgi:hypothetical protein
MAKNVAKKKANPVALIDEAILLADQGSGAEGMDSQDFMIPRISILQQMSPQINKRDGEYVEGADAGDIFNTVTRTATAGDKGIKVKMSDGTMFSPALFYSGYQLTTVPEENDKGTWFGWEVEMLHGSNGGVIENIENGSEIYMAARSFKDSIQQGQVKVTPEDTLSGDEEAF